MENWEIVQSFKDHTGTVVSIALSSDDEFLVTGTFFYGKSETTSDHYTIIKFLISGSGEFAVSVWDLSTGESIARLAGLMAPVSCIAMTK